MFKFLPMFGKRSGGAVFGTLLCLAVSAAVFSVTFQSPLLAADEAASDAKTIENPPQVTRGEVSTPQANSVMLNFRVHSDDPENLKVRVFYGIKDGDTEPDSWEAKTEYLRYDKLKGKEQYTAVLEDLKSDKNYFYRVQAEDGGGITWSEPAAFKTAEASLPIHVTLGIFFGVIAAIVVPFWLGSAIAKNVRMPDYGWRIGLILCSLTFGVIIVYTGWPPSLGIDLSGGVIMVYEIDESVAIHGHQAPQAQEGKEDKAAEDKKAEEGKDKKAAEEDEQTAEEEKAASEQSQKDMMKKMLAAIAMRVNPGGEKEVSIRQRGYNAIEITVPRASPEKVARIKAMIVETGTLEFRILASQRDPNHREIIDAAKVATDTNELTDEQGALVAWWVPVDEGREDEFNFNQNIVTRTANVAGVPRLEVLVLKDNFDVTGDYLDRSMESNDEYGRPCVRFTFNTVGAKRFGVLTGNNLPVEGAQPYSQHLGIILNGDLYSAPTIQSRITGDGIIHGRFTKEEVEDLVNVLNAGSLPAALKKNPISELSIGPTLGSDTVRKGKIAISISVIIVFIFMAIYYGFAGLVACGALLMNILLLFGIMIGINADFTLPGIAGLVLTVGMAVDANVLIFERIREELDRGAALRMAIRNGFAKATTTIIDANVTTLITAIILFVVGTPQLKGFAVTLFLGITLSMFTAIFCARVVFDIAERRRIITKLSMMRMLGKTNFNFVGMQKIGVIVSIVVICFGLFAIFERGKGVLDIDFTGGESVTLLFKEEQKIGDIRKDLTDILPDLTVSDVQLSDEGVGKRFVINTSLEVDSNAEGKESISAIQVVEDKLFEIYGEKLATNGLESRNSVSLDANGVPTAELEPAKPKEEAKPKADAQPSATSSGESTAMIDDEVAEAKPADEKPAEEAKPAEVKPAEEKPAEAKPADEKPAEQPKAEAKPAVKAAPALVTNRFANGTMAKLVLAKSLDYDAMKDLVSDTLKAAKIPMTAFTLTNDEYSPGDTEGFNDWTLRIALPQDEVETKVLQPLGEKLASIPFFPSSSSIGSRIADDYKEAGIIAIIASLVCIIIYIWIRFQRVVFGLAAVIALVHDVLVTLGAIAVSAYVASALGFLLIDEFKISLSVLAALLTIIGYSLNDTIVVFDRIREVRGKSPNITGDMVNMSLNQTLSRTLLTSLTTFIVVVVLYIGGGSGIHAFSFTLIVGVVVGTYSSIFIASPALLWMSRTVTPKK